MRHRKRRSKLSMMTAHRNAMLRNMVQNLFKYQKIQTTTARAKVARRLAEKLITLAKSDTVVSRRRVYEHIPDRDLIGKLFKEIAPLFKDRNSGFTRIIPLGFRRGDGASLCVFELTEKKIVEKLPKKKHEKAKKEEIKEAAHAKEIRREAEETPKKPKEDAKLKTIPKAKPTVQEEKMVEKAKSEEKKVADKRGFMKNLRGLFRKRGDR